MGGLETDAIEALTGGAGRGFTVLCTIADSDLLTVLAGIVGPTGLIVAAGPEPPSDLRWSAVRSDPARAIPVRSHVVDAAVIEQTASLPELAGEVRRVLVPSGDVRLLLAGVGDVDAALGEASIRSLRREPAGVLIARGP